MNLHVIAFSQKMPKTKDTMSDKTVLTLIIGAFVGLGFYWWWSSREQKCISVNENDPWEVKRSRVKILEKLGNGSFGDVCRGFIKNFGSLSQYLAQYPCAIKMVRKHASDQEKADFLSEASVMKGFDTHHVVRTPLV
uniref:Insulin-like receptor n=1 Tax=Cacopsylla melanoneura TaxID=428564 RepID=A0A8D8YT48_9HEMI